MFTIFIIYVFCFGAIVGSFLNMLIWRLPRKEGVGGRSKCPKCGHALSWNDLVPVASFMSLGGKCRYCRAAIASRYFFVEVVTGALFASLYAFAAPGAFMEWVTLGLYLFIAAVSVLVFVIDLEHYLILDIVVLPSAAAVLGLRVVESLFVSHSFAPVLSALAGALLGSLPFFSLWYFSRGKWMGFGDVKYMGFIGLALGWPLVLSGFFFSVFTGSFFGLMLVATGKKHMGSRVPFGTFLSLGTILAIFFGEKVLVWYLGLIGF